MLCRGVIITLSFVANNAVKNGINNRFLYISISEYDIFYTVYPRMIRIRHELKIFETQVPKCTGFALIRQIEINKLSQCATGIKYILRKLT